MLEEYLDCLDPAELLTLLAVRVEDALLSSCQGQEAAGQQGQPQHGEVLYPVHCSLCTI